MQKLRQSMPAVVIFLILMFVALIVFEWGDARRGRGAVHAGGQVIGTVNGEEISSTEYESRVSEAIDMQRQANPQGDVDDEQVREGVWTQLIDEKLVEQAADRLGIMITDDQLRDILFYDPPEFLKAPFTDSTGNFQQAAYFEFMKDPSGFLSQRKFPPNEVAKVMNQLLQAQEQIRRMKLREAVESVVASSLVPAPSVIRTAFNQSETKASGTYAYLDANLIPDNQVNVTEADARKYYDAHQDNFQQKPGRELRYVLFPIVPSTQDSGTITRRLKTVMEAMSRAATTAAKDSAFADFAQQYGTGQYNGASFTPLQEVDPELQASVAAAAPGTVIGPVHLRGGTTLVEVVDVRDSGETYVKAQHILLRSGQGANDDSLKKQAEQIAQRARGGENFNALAQQYSGDPGSAQRGGDLGYFKKGMMVKPFDEAVFSNNNPVGSIIGPIKTDFGYHIIKVNDRTTKAYKIRDLKFDVRVGNTTKNLIRRRANDFRDLLVAGQSIDSAAAKEKVQVMESGPVSRAQPIGGSSKLTSFTFNGKVGDVSDVIEMRNNGYIVAQISKVHNPGRMDFADAKNTIMEKLRLEKKLDMLKARAEKLRAGIVPGDSLSKLSTIDPSVQVRPFSDVTPSSPFPGVGFDYALTSSIFGMQAGQTSNLIRGEHGYFIVALASKQQPTDQDFQARRMQFTQQFMGQRRGQLFQQWMTKERENAEIVDQRGGRS